MSKNAARLRPDPFDVFRFADAAVDLRHRLLVNYLGAETAAGELPVPPVVRQTFLRLMEVTLAINDGRQEDLKIDSHVTVARELVERFEREWLSPDHLSQLEHRKSARGAINELTEHDWAEIRRDASAEVGVPSPTSLDAVTLRDSPFRHDEWAEYEAAVNRFVDTFDPPGQTLYRLVRVLAAVCYPDPATYDATRGTLPVYDDEYLIKHVNAVVRQLVLDFQNQTCFNLNVGEWLDPGNTYGSVVRLFDTVGEILRGWRGEVSVPPELDRPRWQPAKRGSANQGVLSFRGLSTTVSNQSRVIVPVLQAFEDVSWQRSVPFPPGKVVRVVLQSLDHCAAKDHLPLTFSSESVGSEKLCRWHSKDQSGEPKGAQEGHAEPEVKNHP